MMRTLLIIPLILMLGMLNAQSATIIASKNGKEITLERLTKELGKYDVIFFGEYHDNAIIHDLQSRILPLMHAANPRLILSFEMFERDVQTDLNPYLDGSIDEEEFLERSRPWPNYPTDYRPLVEFAKAHDLPAIAANIPRRLAGLVARNGIDALRGLSTDDQVLMAVSVSAPEGAYKDKFIATMQANGMHGNGGDNEMYERLFFAQCMKDDTMAESIAQYREVYPKHKIIHFNGDFHSREFLGTVERLKSRMPKTKIAVISPQFASDPLPKKLKTIANYIIMLPDDAVEEGE